MAYLAVEKARECVLGDIQDSFHGLDFYVDCLRKSNPGSHIILDVDDSNSRFKRIFVSFASCIEGFNYCRPMMFIDGTHLLGKFKGHLLGATAKDGDNGLYHVAFAIVDSENSSNWRWFMANLKNILSPFREVTFVSDRNPGLLDAMSKEFPGNPHGHCLNHLITNLKYTYRGRNYSKSLRGRMEWLLKNAAYASTVEMFEEFKEKFIKEGGYAARNFLDNMDVTQWANAYFRGRRYGEMSSNAAESFNKWVLEERNLPITKLGDTIRIKLMGQISAREIVAKAWTTDSCPSIVKKLQLLTDQVRLWPVTQSSESVFEVHSNPSMEVKLDCQTCTCRQWQICELPCSHALACILRTGRPISTYVDEFYHVDAYVRCYSYHIQPVPMFGRSQDSSDTRTVIPPTTKRPPGRPRKKRILSQGEHIPRRIKCGRCGRVGNHNKKSCTEPLK